MSHPLFQEEEEEEEEEALPLVLPPSLHQLQAVWKAISDHEYADPFRFVMTPSASSSS